MFELPKLPYEYDALAPYINKDIQLLHHDKHHRAYVDGTNKALAAHPDWLAKPIEEVIANLNQVPEDARAAVKNVGGGHANHSFFWKAMAPAKGQKPSGELLDKIKDAFGDLETMQKQFSESASKIFGSGWQWLVYDNGKLKLETTPNQESPLTAGKTPLLTLDVWEHAYYLQYYNKRADYITAWWNIVNWDFAAAELDKAQNS